MNRTYYSILTKRFTLRTSHTDWLEITQKLYNEVLLFYYELFLDHSEIHEMNRQQMLRYLEQLSIVGKNRQPVSDPLPWNKIPLYFRRACINEAIAAGKSYLSRKNGSRKQDYPTKAFSTGITFYKGMYRDLESGSVSLKIYDGEKWRWLHCRLSGNHFEEFDECMSPRLIFKEKRIELQVPVKYSVDDGRKLKSRIGEDLRICAIQFTNADAMAAMCIMDESSELERVCFIRGGNNYRERCWNILNDIHKSEEATGWNITQNEQRQQENLNRKYWKKLKYIAEDMAHQVSCKIVDACIDSKVSVIVLPKYEANYSRMIMASLGKWSPLYLSHRIISMMKYKAWKQGILIVEVESSDISRYCAICGSLIRKKGEEYICENNHKGNRHLNSARNLGKKFLNNIKKAAKGMQ